MVWVVGWVVVLFNGGTEFDRSEVSGASDKVSISSLLGDKRQNEVPISTAEPAWCKPPKRQKVTVALMITDKGS